MEKSVEVVFVPPPWITHLVPIMEFAKLLIGRDHRIRITVLVMEPVYQARQVLEYIKLVSCSESRIRFVDLPRMDLIPTVEIESPERRELRTIESYAPSVRDALAEMVSTVRVVGLVVDVSTLATIDAGDEFGVPSYIFSISNAANINVLLNFPIRDDDESSELSKSGPELAIPGFANSVPPMVLPSVLFNKKGGYSKYFAALSRRFRDAKGIIVNSLSELEPYAFSCFSDSEFRIRNRNPPVYGVGPALYLEARAHQATEREKIIDWLDDQPPASVVFLCFGSAGGRFGVPQVREIALALERGGFRFLWIIHATTNMLPEGFKERIGGRGVICEWAPQAEVLAHVAIGGFVSHCGWNSVLESLWSGVPIATWPLRAEQQLNAFLLVKELGGLAVEMRLDSRMGGDLVPADEIERAVRRLMDGDDEVKNRVKEMETIMKKALLDGGSSFASLGLLIKDMIGNNE